MNCFSLKKNDFFDTFPLHLFQFNEISGYSLGSIADNEKVSASIIQQRQL